MESIVSSLLENLEVDTQLGEESIPSKLSGEASTETDIVSKEIPIKIDRAIGVESPVTMDPFSYMDYKNPFS